MIKTWLIYHFICYLSMAFLCLIPLTKRSLQNDLFQQHPAPLFTRIAFFELIAAWHLKL